METAWIGSSVGRVQAAGVAIAAAVLAAGAGSDPFALLRSERIGGLQIGSEAARVFSVVTCPIRRGPDRLWAADGAWHQSWDAPACGIQLDMVSERADGPKTVASIRITAPSSLRTARGIGIGSPEASVRRLYADAWNRQESRLAGTFVAGSIYGGLIVRFEAGTAREIFLGAAAE